MELILHGIGIVREAIEQGLSVLMVSTSIPPNLQEIAEKPYLCCVVTVHEKKVKLSSFFGRCPQPYSTFILVCVRNAESQYGTYFFASER